MFWAGDVRRKALTRARTQVGNRAWGARRYSGMALRVPLRPSRLLAYALIAAHGASVCVLIPLDVAIGLKLGGVVMIALGLAHSLWRIVLLRHARALIAIQLDEGDRLNVQTRDGQWHEARILGTTYVRPAVIVLNLSVPGCRLARHVVIAPDSAHPAALRRMRVWLRWAYATERGKPGAAY